MVLVNLQGSEQASFWQLVHSRWHGVTAADLVFPFFLLATGVSTALALDRRGGAPGLPVVLRRAASLFAIGLALGWLLRPSLDPTDLRVVGVLQRIAIVYLVCALLCRRTAGPKPVLWTALLVLVAHGILLLAAPPDGLASFQPGQGMSGWLDREWLPGRAHRGSWDPEGLLSTLSAVTTGLIGVAAQRLLARSASPTTVLAAAAAAFAALGMAASIWLPLNKALWTPSFALVTAGAGLAVLAGLRAVSFLGVRGPLEPLAVLGKTALTLYVVHMVLIAVLIRPWLGSTLWDRSYALLGDAGLAPAIASLAYAGVAGGLSIAVTLLLRNRGLALRV